MANGSAHRIGAGVALVAIQATDDHRRYGKVTERTLIAGVGGMTFGTLPDLIEPAFRNPNHRQFFHSVAFAGLVAYGLWEAYHWEPVTDGKRFLRGLTLIAGVAYLVHLAMDARTARSLPLI